MTFSRHGLSTCRACGQTVRWSQTEARKRQPLNPEPDPAGSVVARLGANATWHSRVPTTELPQASFERRFMPHAATCAATRAVQPELPLTTEPAALPPGVASLAAHRRTRSNP